MIRASDTLDVRRVLIAGALIIVAVLMAVGVAWGLVWELGGTAPVGHAPPRDLQPQLETHPIQDVNAYRAQEQAKISSYGWVDPNAGVVRIPVERAMDLIVSRERDTVR